MGTFLGVSCDIIRARTTALKTTTQVFVEPGQDGYGVHLLGQGDAAFVFILIEYGTPAAVDTWIALIEAKQGQQGTVTDDWPVSHLNMFVRAVNVPTKTAESGNGGARGQIVVEGVKLA